MDADEQQTVTVEIAVRRGPLWLAAHGYPPDAEIIETYGPFPAELVDQED